jgi:hypothetical protein
MLFTGAPAFGIQSAYFHSLTGPGPGQIDVVLFGAPSNWVVLGFELPPSGVYATGYQDLFTSAGGSSFLSVSTGFSSQGSGACLVVFQSNDLPQGAFGPCTATVSVFDLTTGQFLGGATTAGNGYIQN